MSHAFKNNQRDHRPRHEPTRHEIAVAMAEIDYRSLGGRPGFVEHTRRRKTFKRKGLFLKKRYGRRGLDGTLISSLDLRQRRNALLHRLHEAAQ